MSVSAPVYSEEIQETDQTDVESLSSQCPVAWMRGIVFRPDDVVLRFRGQSELKEVLFEGGESGFPVIHCLCWRERQDSDYDVFGHLRYGANQI